MVNRRKAKLGTQYLDLGEGAGRHFLAGNTFGWFDHFSQ
jgi:hypothetical protein